MDNQYGFRSKLDARMAARRVFRHIKPNGKATRPRPRWLAPSHLKSKIDGTKIVPVRDAVDNVSSHDLD